VLSHAALPSWIILVIVLSAMGPMMRMIFGEHYSARKRKRFDRNGSEDVARLDAALAERDTVIEDLQHRLSELESRLDFTERLLAERSSAGRESSPVDR
jgi:hypothetical protein